MEGTPLDALSGSERFTLRRELGRGGMGVVYDAFDRVWNLRVAVKTLRALQPEALLRLKNEFRAIAGIHHPNLVRLGELLEEHGRWLFTMELIEGVDFVRWVRADGHPDETRLRAALSQLAGALHALHTLGKVHRDVKPNNVLVTADGRVVLLDFGLITRVATDDAFTDGLVVGTAEYMAPEQATGGPVSTAADWYAVGVMLYEALTGRLPFAGTPPAIVEAKQRHAAPSPHGAPPALARLCSGLLDRDPDRRFGWSEIVAALHLAVPPLDAGAQEPPFVGRSRELATLEQAFADTQAGQRVTLFVQGESGIGKSMLVQRFVRSVCERVDGVLVLASHASDRELVPFNAFDGIVDGLMRYLADLPAGELGPLLPDDADALAAVFPVLARVAAIGRRTPPPGESAVARRKRAFVALRELLTRVAARRPLVLVIEDFQWADDDSLALRRAIMGGDGAAGRLLIATVRTTGDSKSFLRRALLGTDESPGQVRQLVLDRLSDAEALTLVHELRGNGGAESEERAIVHEGHGHPLFLTEIARSGGAAARTAGDLHATICARVDALSPEAGRLLELLAVGGGPIRQSIAAPAADLTNEELARAVDETRAAGLTLVAGAGLFAAIEPYHDEIRRAIAERVPPLRRQALHRALAEVIEWAAGGTEPRTLYTHWLAAGDHGRAASAAVQAAEEADRQLAFELAADYYARAIDLAPDRAPQLLPRRAAALANAGRKHDAVATYREAAQRTSGATRIEHLRCAAEVLLRNGDIDEGVTLLRSVLDEVQLRWPRGPRRLMLSLLANRALVRLRGLGWAPHDEQSLPPQTLLRIDTAWSAAMALSLVDRARGADFQTRGLRLALDAGEPYRVARAVILEAGFSCTEGTHARARTHALLEEGRRLAERCAHPHALALIAAVEGIAPAMEGQFRAGAERLLAAEPLLREHGSRWDLLNAEYLHLMVLAHIGDLAQLETRARRMEAEARASEDYYTLANVCNGSPALVRLLDDDVAGARALSEETMRSWSQQGFHRQHWFALYAQAHFDLYQGAGEKAWQRLAAHWRPLTRSLLLRSQFVRVGALNLRASAALATGRDRRAAHDARLLEREGVPYAGALASLIRAQLASDPAALLRAAAQLDGVGLRLNAAVARRRAGRDDPWFSQQRVANPDGFVRCFAPGGRW